jgi:hypothetical protein
VGEDREQGLTLRLASAADAAVIADLVRLAFSTQSVPTNPPSSALKETPASVMRELEQGGGAVVASGSAMVGAVLWREEAGSLYVGRLAVRGQPAPVPLVRLRGRRAPQPRRLQ